MALSGRALVGGVLLTGLGWLIAAPGCDASGGKDKKSSSSSGPGGGGGMGGGFGFGGQGGGGPVGGVPQTCAEAVEQQSYIGCEYWPTVTSNAGLFDGFEFAIVVANPTGSSADVTVERGGVSAAQVALPAGGIQTIALPWVPQLKGDDTAGDGSGIVSALVPDGAYHVVSSVPITVYEFNALEFELAPAPPDCPQLGAPGCFSYTNDASLLLPTTALRGDYYILSRPTLHLGFFGNWANLPGFLSVTATADGTTVTVESTAHVRAGAGVSALTPGGTGTYTLDAGDVLMLTSGTPPAADTPLPGQPCLDDPTTLARKCPTGPDYDLTGTHVTADKPISVIGGHDCTFVPYSEYACDHIEESMFPVEALGQDMFITAPQAVMSIGQGSTPDFMFVRVLSAVDGNEITFTPAVNAPVTLNAGEWIEIGPVNQDFRIQAANKILVGQYMVGENFSGVSAGAGDPDLSVGIPVEQFRVSYSFLAPETYTHNFVNVVTATGTQVSIDGSMIPLAEFTEIAGTGYSVARHQIQGGFHVMEGNDNFGITVYGYGSYTSYMYPGGLNLETVIIDPE
jgi:hypothetical protein